MGSTTQASAERLSADDLPEYLDSNHLERFTGVKASTWRYWDSVGSGPPSLKLGRRRLWRKAAVLAWLEDQEAASA